MKNMTYEEFCKEVDKLKKKASSTNKKSGHVMVVVSTRIKQRK